MELPAAIEVVHSMPEGEECNVINVSRRRDMEERYSWRCMLYRV